MGKPQNAVSVIFGRFRGGNNEFRRRFDGVSCPAPVSFYLGSALVIWFVLFVFVVLFVLVIFFGLVACWNLV
jgi:hypothetical protein